MRALRHFREVSSDESPFAALLAQFSATTLELNPSLGTVEFARRLSARSATMFGARGALLVLSRGSNWYVAAMTGPGSRSGETVENQIAKAMGGHAYDPSFDLQLGPAVLLVGQGLAETLGWNRVALVRLASADGSLLGVLALIDPAHSLSVSAGQLLQALASHASAALENVRMFSRMEQSRKQWVEDFDAISDLILVHDSADRVLRLNRALADRLCLHPTEAIGRDIREFDLLGSTAGRCAFCDSPNDPLSEFTHHVYQRTYLISTSHIRSDEGAVRTMHVLKDITDRLEAERRYRRERDFNKNILNSTQSMILVLDTAGLISYANPRCMEAGYRSNDLLGYPLAQMVPPARRPLFTQALDQALSGVRLDLEVPLVRGNRTVGQFSISLSPMRNDQEEINSVVVAMTDVTDAIDLKAKLMHAEKMAALGQLVSGVAHEINNPLAAIMGFTDLLLENNAVPGEAKEELRVILQEAQRTRVIVQNLLSFARQWPAQSEPVGVNAVLRQTLKLRAYDFASHGIDLAERYEEELPLVLGDAHQLQQVFLNILNNAYDAVREQGRPGKIEITTVGRCGELEIAFRDNGPGISQPDRIFDPFFTTKEVGKGTGLGLSICYGIVHAHRGEILAHNNEDGLGCTFIVRLPVVGKSVEAVVGEAAQ